MRSRTPPGRGRTISSPVPIGMEDLGCAVDITVDVSTIPAPFPAIEVLILKHGAGAREWVRLEPNEQGEYEFDYACTIYDWRTA